MVLSYNIYTSVMIFQIQARLYFTTARFRITECEWIPSYRLVESIVITSVTMAD